MPFFHHQDIDFAYEQSGVGPLLVFCHGLTGDQIQIRERLGHLPNHRLVTWDARAHGRTETVGPSEEFTFEQFATDLRALLLHLEIERTALGGVSMGAGVAVRFALDWPEVVSALILVRPAWLDQPAPRTLKVCEQIGELLARFGSAEGRRRFENSPEYQELSKIDPETARQFCEQFDRPQAAERCVRLQRMPRSCPIHNWQEVSQLKMPTLVIGCEPDYVHPYEYAMEWSKRLPNARLVKVPPKSADSPVHDQQVRHATLAFINALGD